MDTGTFTKDDLKKVINNHNKILKKEKIKATGGIADLKARVMKEYRLETNTSELAVFVQRKGSPTGSIKYILNKKGSERRAKQDKKFTDKKAAKKTKAAASKKKREEKKAKMLSDERIKTVKALNTLKKLKGRKTKTKPAAKAAKKVAAKPKTLKLKFKLKINEKPKEKPKIKKVAKIAGKPEGKEPKGSSPPKSIDRKDKKAMGDWYKKKSEWNKYRAKLGKIKRDAINAKRKSKK